MALRNFAARQGWISLIGQSIVARPAIGAGLGIRNLGAWPRRDEVRRSTCGRNWRAGFWPWWWHWLVWAVRTPWCPRPFLGTRYSPATTGTTAQLAPRVVRRSRAGRTPQHTGCRCETATAAA